jgi:hypothetical protein
MTVCNKIEEEPFPMQRDNGYWLRRSRRWIFERCLAKNRDSPEQRREWREGIYDQVREVMSIQGRLSIERMCVLAMVSRAGFYRSLQKRGPEVEEKESVIALQSK